MFLMPDTKWARLLAYVTGLVNQKLLLQNEYSQPRIASFVPTFPSAYGPKPDLYEI